MVVAVVGEASYTVEVVVFPFEAAFDIVEACKLLEELVDLVAVVVSFDQAYLDVVVGPFDIDLVEVAGLAVVAPSLAFVDVAGLAVVVVVASSFEDAVDMDYMAVVVEPSLVVVVEVDLELQVVVVASDLVDSSSSFEDAVAAVVVVVVEASFVVDKDYTFVVAVAVEVVDLVPFDSLLVVVVVVAFVVAFAVAVVVAVELLLFVFCQFLVT